MALILHQQAQGEISATPHRLFSILSIGQMRGWKNFHRQPESKGLNLISVQPLHALEETELSMPQNTACLCLASWVQVCVHGGKTWKMTTKQHLREAGYSPALWRFVIWSNYTDILSNFKEHILEIYVNLPLQTNKLSKALVRQNVWFCR